MPKHDVFDHALRFAQHKMLMKHADPQSLHFMRRTKTMRDAIDRDRSRIWLDETIEDFHRRGFSRSVFTEYSLYRSLADAQVHISIRNTVTVAFSDAAKLNLYHVDGLLLLLEV